MFFYFIVEEIESTNEPMAAVVSMWRDPPTMTERAEHQRIVHSLSNKQQVAMNGLQDIIQKEKGSYEAGFPHHSPATQKSSC